MSSISLINLFLQAVLFLKLSVSDWVTHLVKLNFAKGRALVPASSERPFLANSGTDGHQGRRKVLCWTSKTKDLYCSSGKTRRRRGRTAAGSLERRLPKGIIPGWRRWTCQLGSKTSCQQVQRYHEIFLLEFLTLFETYNSMDNAMDNSVDSLSASFCSRVSCRIKLK